MGPAIETERYSVPSLFFFIFTSLIPCKGAIVTPSVTIANPTRTARSSFSSNEALGREYLPRAISFDRISAEISFPLIFSSSLRGSAISISCILETRSAKSNAILGSIIPEESTKLDFASAAFSKMVNVSVERFE